ncbi:MAG: carbohydrate kinase family protein [Firmicutes bacterium]|nr:carbohydrate kinase family protein [Bacillota bacterium]
MSSKVVVFGDVSLDTNVKVYELPVGRHGDVSYVTNGVNDHVGGSAMNVAFALRKMGVDVHFVSVTGNDFAGRFISDHLDGIGFEPKRLFTDWENTARSVNLVSPDGTRYILHDSKQAMNYEMPISYYEDLLTHGTIVHCSVVNWTRHILKEAKRRGLVTCTDLHTGFDINGYHRDFVENADIVFFSAQNLPHWQEMGHRLLTMGPGMAICTRGAQGCAVFRRKFYKEFPAENFTTDIVDSVGAGDAMAGVYLGCFSKGMNLDECITRAQISGLYACTVSGSDSCYMDIEMLEEVVNRK